MGMTGRGSGFLTVVVVGVALLLPGRCLGARIILPQPGDIGFAGFAQYGTLMKTGEIGEDFGAGAGFGARLRYRMRYERGLGVTFERQGFDPRNKSDADTAAANTTLIATGLEIYQMFGTRTRVTKMLSAGVGLAQVTQKLNDKETQAAGPGVGDGFFVSLGGGLEYFVWQSWAVDVSFRYHAVILHETTNHDIQFGVGLVFYASD
jgi:opacity protein-like surface antigen